MPDTESFTEHLLAQMTLDEKIGQLNQVTVGQDFDPDMLRQGKVGSILNGSSGVLTEQGARTTTRAETANYLQQLALQSRLKIPLIFGRDVIHGHRTVFPIPLAQAAAFDPALAEEAASVAAREASAEGVHWTFAPAVDIARDPRWGRV
ncbi:MAG: glycoside hydrolase family 3 N-terminal domain-containing protein, partial [Anaerolineae bacterium]